MREIWSFDACECFYQGLAWGFIRWLTSLALFVIEQKVIQRTTSFFCGQSENQMIFLLLFWAENRWMGETSNSMQYQTS